MWLDLCIMKYTLDLTNSFLLNDSTVTNFFFQPRFHFNRFQFNLVGFFFITLGLIGGLLLSVKGIQHVLAFNDTTKTWTFNTAQSGTYTYDANLVTVDDSGARPITGVNKLTNPAYTTDTSSWNTAAVPPSGWVEVPGSGTYSTTNFLVMKYEAKCVANADLTTGLTTAANTYADSTTACTSANSRQVASVASGNPIVNITQTNAILRCAAVSLNGTAAHLQTNNEWMTVARDAEAQAGNWSLGSVGSGYLFAGHNDNAPASSRVASSTDTGNNACAYTDSGGTTEAPSACPTNTTSGTSGTAGNQKRVLTLSNGAYIWDIPGNVWEWTNNTITRQQQPVAWNGSVDYATGFNYSDYASGSLTRYIHTWKVGSPLQQVNAGPSNLAYNANQGVGRIYHYSNSADADNTVYGFFRGGYVPSDAGAFALGLNYAPGYSGSTVGFRCASDPVAISQSYSSSSGAAGGPGNIVTIGSITDGKLYQTVNVGDTSTYDLSAYVYDTTSGNVGGTVSSSVAQLYYNGAVISTTYTNIGSGWWKLAGTLTGANASREYGLVVKAGKTVSVDDWTLAKQGTYSVFTTTAYSNSQVSTWDSFSPTVSGSGLASVAYQLCTDDGSACQAGSSWQYWDGDSWETASNTTTHTNTAAQLTQSAMQALPVVSQKLSVKAILSFGGAATPALTSLQVGLTTDTTAPDVNASAVLSVSLSNNLPSATGTTWTSIFTTTTSGTITSVKLTFDTGVNVSSASLGTVIGIGAGTISVSGQSVTYAVTSPALISSGTTITIPLSGIGNPSSTGNYKVAMITNIAGGNLDQGATLAYLDVDGTAGGITANQVAVTADISLVMGFEVYSDPTLITPTTGCNLGNILEGSVNTCIYYLKPSTNSASGYTLNLRSDGDLRSGVNTIDAVPANSSTISAGQERYGINLTAVSTNSTITYPYDNSNYNVIPTSDTQVSSATGPVLAQPSERLDVTHAAAIAPMTAEGSYGQVVTYTLYSN